MSKRSPKSLEGKLEIVQLLLKHEQSISQLSEQYKVSDKTIQSWKVKYEKFGIDVLRNPKLGRDTLLN